MSGISYALRRRSQSHQMPDNVAPVKDEEMHPMSSLGEPTASNNVENGSPGEAPLSHGETVKAMVNCIRDLRHLGVESTVQLPKICVVGDQSAGKSSLIETLSGVKVPRAAGCCTRCPMEVNLLGTDSAEEDWQCRVYLMMNFMYEGHTSQNSQKATKKRPMGPWSSQNTEEIPFAATNDTTKVCDFIHLAQLAILNPGQDWARFAPEGKSDYMDVPEHMQVKFSPNIIRLDISGPKYYNLSFLDLPGIITNPEHKHEKFLVTLVRNLMVEHIKSEDCIVILTIPMSNDVENSTAFSLIQDNDADPRTLGVLTKPDRIQQTDSLDKWQEMIAGDSNFSLGYGFHAVMMDPNTALSHEEVVVSEESFFDSPQWQEVKAKHTQRIGIRSLERVLESLLADKISQRLPRIVKQIDNRVLDIHQQLKEFPKPTSIHQLPTILVELLTEFRVALRSLFSGGESAASASFWSEWKNVSQGFRRALEDSRPSLLLTASSVRPEPSATPRSSSISTPKETLKAINTTAIIIEDSAGEDVDSGVSFSEGQKWGKTFRLSYIRQVNREYDNQMIPNAMIPKAIEALSREGVAHWGEPLTELLVRTKVVLMESVLHILDRAFAKYRITEMFRKLTEGIKRFLNAVIAEQTELANGAFDIERTQPFTLDSDRYEVGRISILRILQERRHNVRLREVQAEIEKKHVDGTLKGKPRIVRDEEISAARDPFATELEIMARVRAYYQIASSRFADNICQSIQARLFSKCGTELSTALTDNADIRIDSEEARTKIAHMMMENPERERQRLGLLRELDRFSTAQLRLKDVFGEAMHDQQRLTREGGRMETEGDVDTEAFPSRKQTMNGAAFRTPDYGHVKPESPVEAEIPTPTPGSRKRKRTDDDHEIENACPDIEMLP